MSTHKSLFSRYRTYIHQAPESILHLHAILFASCITLLLGCALLYFEYGFWRETYYSVDTSVLEGDKIQQESISPFQMLTDMKDRFNATLDMNKVGAGFFDGKEVYSQKESFLKGE
ncbi:MAG: hypothetical protein RI935_639 [Candidatus Parcubacteria bacterium]